ncbi:hypothetical protein F5146DRAFT_1000318 [Armillaria mellea]|nr:hypothetical protein F5146DRAFT_1000318 [Armillaria mellea]
MPKISCESIYSLTETIDSPQNAILCLGTTEDGSYLAAGVLMWIRCTDEPKEILFFGTQNGYIACWKQIHEGSEEFEEKLSIQIHNPGEITSMDFDSTSNRLVVANRNGSIVLFSVESTIVPFGMQSIKDYIPTSIAFGQVSGNNTIRDILIFGLGGQIHLLKDDKEKLTIHKTLLVSGMIGSAAVTTAKDAVCIDDPTEGAALYKLQDGARVRTFPIPATCLNGVPCIMAARSRELEDTAKNFIWTKRSDEKQPTHHIFNLKHFIWVFMLLATVGFIYQNILLASKHEGAPSSACLTFNRPFTKASIIAVHSTDPQYYEQSKAMHHQTSSDECYKWTMLSGQIRENRTSKQSEAPHSDHPVYERNLFH